jgi:hypothetical protein
VDKDGTISYSQVASVYFQPFNMQVSVYPNPVKEMLRLRIMGVMNGPYSLSVVDMAGRSIRQQKIQGHQAGNEISIPMKELPAQLYMILIRNEKNNIVYRQKIMKDN